MAQKPDDLDALLLLRRRRGDARADPRRHHAARDQARDARRSRPGGSRAGPHARSKDLPRAEQLLQGGGSSKPEIRPRATVPSPQLHLGKGELAEAEKEFKAAADLAPARSRAPLQLADSTCSRAGSRTRRRSSVTSPRRPRTLSAWLRLAEIAFAEGKRRARRRRSTRCSKADKDNAGAHILQTRIYLAKRDAAKAVASATAATKAEPRNALAASHARLAQAAAGNPRPALGRGQGRGGASPMFRGRAAAPDGAADAGRRHHRRRRPRSRTTSRSSRRTWEALGTALLRTRDAAGALASYTKANALAPANLPDGRRAAGAREEGRGAAARSGARDRPRLRGAPRAAPRQ